ncbi:MAG: twin-arginine translocase TatA/TatE family subunit [Actinomycetota bacterium]|nr:twin-arginine translocase TatA/TatE family subunit [Actinomycetota bacterium]
MSAAVFAEIFGPDGLIVIAVVVVVLLFGGSQLPKLARGLGSASHEFKKGLEQGGNESSSSSSSATDSATGGTKESSGG